MRKFKWFQVKKFACPFLNVIHVLYSIFNNKSRAHPFRTASNLFCILWKKFVASSTCNIWLSWNKIKTADRQSQGKTLTSLFSFLSNYFFLLNSPWIMEFSFSRVIEVHFFLFHIEITLEKIFALNCNLMRKRTSCLFGENHWAECLCLQGITLSKDSFQLTEIKVFFKKNIHISHVDFFKIFLDLLRVKMREWENIINIQHLLTQLHNSPWHCERSDWH